MARSGTTIGVAHYCEGAGHATRMLSIAERIRRAGHRIVMAGGGPGERFVSLNGFDEFVPLSVDFIEAYQEGNLLVVLRRSMPNLYERVRDYVSWLDGVQPRLLVTDDLSAAVAAAVTSTGYYYVSHDPAAFYETAAERVGAWLRNRFARLTAREFFFPKVWRGPPRIPGAERVGPIAPRADGGADAVDVLLVPSAFTEDRRALADRIRRAGRDVTVVGGPEWETRESLQPSVEAASVVVCSGYSTVMEAAVAGTPCVVRPCTSEQRGVARALAGTPGFRVARSPGEVADALDEVESPRTFDNGVGTVVRTATADVGD